ncbi:MAG: competence/damage-inducible protein A [Bacteroidales bacterium]|nr:competence/damage-inducible protein A [Bacteroidales bacterium]
MNAEIITIGDEILIGQIVDSNSAFIANQLNEAGIKVKRIFSISDNKEDIIHAINNAFTDCDLVLITGGLGPTNDDITKHTLAEYFNSKLVRNPEVLAHIEDLLGRRGVQIIERNIQQADLPDNCRIINNIYGTAAGMWFEKNNKILVSMPGVQYEMREMMTNYIIPTLIKEHNLPVILHKTVLTYGLPESVMAEKIKNWENQLPEDIKLAYLPSPGILKLRLSAYGNNLQFLSNLVNKTLMGLQKIIPDNIFGYDNDRLEQLIGGLLQKNKTTCATAESCTGGRIAELITAVPGASRYFKGSVVAYSNDVKTSVLNVNQQHLEKFGAVSKEVVIEMAEGVKHLLLTDYAIATSGIAGPDGGTQEKPVGTVWIAVASPGATIAQKFQMGEHRGRNIEKSAIAALFMLWKTLQA